MRKTLTVALLSVLATLTLGWAASPSDPSEAPRCQAARLIADRITSGQPLYEDWTWKGAPPVVGEWNDLLVDAYWQAEEPQAASWLRSCAPESDQADLYFTPSA